MPMTKFIIWNTKGANSPTFRWHYEEMEKEHKLALLVLLETKTMKHKHITEVFQFDAQNKSAMDGFSGGIVVM